MKLIQIGKMMNDILILKLYECNGFFLIKKYKNVNIFSISNILYRKKAKKVK